MESLPVLEHPVQSRLIQPRGLKYGNHMEGGTGNSRGLYSLVD